MQFYLQKNGQRQGPLTETQIRAGIDSGEYKLDDLAWTSGKASWQRLSTVIPFDLSSPPPTLAEIEAPPITHQVSAVAKLPHLQWKVWCAATRDAFIVFILSSIGGAVSTLSPEDSQPVALIVSSASMSILGFTVAGFRTTNDRFPHLLRVALLFWMASLINVVVFDLPVSQWLFFGSIVILVTMHVGWGLSLLLNRLWKRPRGTEPLTSPFEEAITESGAAPRRVNGASLDRSGAFATREGAMVRMINVSAGTLYALFAGELLVTAIPWWVDEGLGLTNFPSSLLGWFFFRMVSVALLQIFRYRWLSFLVVGLTAFNAITCAVVLIKGGWATPTLGSMATFGSFIACGFAVLAMEASITLYRSRSVTHGDLPLRQ